MWMKVVETRSPPPKHRKMERKRSIFFRRSVCCWPFLSPRRHHLFILRNIFRGKRPANNRRAVKRINDDTLLTNNFCILFSYGVLTNVLKCKYHCRHTGVSGRSSFKRAKTYASHVSKRSCVDWRT